MPPDESWLLDPAFFGKASSSSSGERSVVAHTPAVFAQTPAPPTPLPFGSSARDPAKSQVRSVFSNVWSRAQTVVESAKDKLATSNVVEKIRAPPTTVSAEEKDGASQPSKPIVVSLSDNLRAAFPFASYADSYCVFGSFRRRTSRLSAYADRPFEAVCENLSRSRLSRLIARDFAAHSSIAAASKQALSSRGCNQIVYFSAGPHFFDLRYWLVCRGYGPHCGLLIDWVAFTFTRRFITRLHASAKKSPSSPRQALEAADIRELLRQTHTEISEDLNLFTASFEDSETETLASIGDSGVTLTAGVVCGASNCCVISLLGDLPTALITIRRTNCRLPNAYPLLTWAAGMDRGGPQVSRHASNKILHSRVHLFTDSRERLRIKSAVSKAYAAEVARDLQRRMEMVAANNDTRRRMIFSIRRGLAAGSGPVGDFQVDETENDEQLLLVEKRKWIGEKLTKSAMGIHGISRGFGFTSSQELGLVAVPDFVELHVNLIKPSISPRRKEPPSPRPVPSQFLLVFSSPYYQSLSPPKELANLLAHYLHGQQRSITEALSGLSQWLRTEAAARDETTQEELTLLCVPLQWTMST